MVRKKRNIARRPPPDDYDIGNPDDHTHGENDSAKPDDCSATNLSKKQSSAGREKPTNLPGKMPNKGKTPKNKRSKPTVDSRKQLYNDCRIGPIEQIQLPTEMITQLGGILLDIDPHLFRKSSVPRGVRTDPREFFAQVVYPWLQRHTVLQDAEVLISGRGLHVIIWFDKPVEFASDGDRQRWGGIVKTIQAVLPTDPDAPGITATTRARGSINSKNGATVKRLQPGKPVEIDSVLKLYDQLCKRPFRTVMDILFGTDRLEPCAVCQGEYTTLSGLDFGGRCYESCGKVQLAQLYDVFLVPRQPTEKGK